MSNHLRPDFNLVEIFPGVDPDNRSNHLWNDNHVTKMCLNKVWLLVWLRFLLCLAKFLDQTHGLALQTAVKSSAGTGVNDIPEVGGGEVEESMISYKSV